jgi:hypothetical protein
MVIKVGESPYIFTLTDLLYKGGYIISIKPTPKGMFVVPEENELIKVIEDGRK